MLKYKLFFLFFIISIIIIIFIFNLNNRDSNNPTLVLIGDNSVKLKLGDRYIEEGFKAFDKFNKNITENVIVTDNINYYKPGNYKLSYKVVDDYGNTSVSYRYVDILSESDFNKKIIYLTFDDGPSNITKELLKILKKENVKATFFVINKHEKYNYLIKKAYSDGHTIGLHSYSHKYNEIYKDTNSYMEDLKLIKNKVEKIINSKINIIRFPGGSSNTINHNMKKFINEVINNGYYYYDWNISSFDTSNISSKTIYNRVINQLSKTNYKTNIILMHDYSNNNKILEAVKYIIKYGKENNYLFSNINKYTPLVRHRY